MIASLTCHVNLTSHAPAPDNLRIAPLLDDKLAVPGARLPLLRHGAVVVFKKFSFPKITNKGHLTYKNYLLETK